MFSKKKYIESVNAKGIFDNTYETKIPQTVIASAILNHFEKSEKKPKCIFIGWDGCRCDAMKYLVKSEDKNISIDNDSALFSAINEVKNSGGLYISYVGGEKGNTQETSTAQGWSSALCGKWMKSPWKTGIEWSLDDDYPTVLKKLSVKGYKTSFNAIWPVHFDNTYKNEIAFAEQNDLQQYYFKFETDAELFENIKDRIKKDDDFIFGIFENPDTNGHSTGFGEKNYRYVSGICNLDRISYTLLREIKARKSFENEDWLVVIASDHGGHSTRHGSQNIQDTTTFLALSKPIENLV